MSVAGNDNGNGDIIFTIKDTKLCVPVVTLSTRNSQKLTKLLSTGFKRSVYWNEYKKKNENKNTTNEYRYFLESNFIGVNRLFVLVYSNEDADSRRFKAKRCFLPKGIIKNYNVVINGKTFMIKQSNLIWNDMKKLENWQQDKIKVILLDVYYTMII